MGRIIAVMSGKGGVGKSTLSAALAVYLAERKQRVTLLDGDIGLRCADLMLNMQDQVVYDLGDLAENTCTLDQALLPHPKHASLFLLAAPQLLKPSDVKAKKMAQIIEGLGERMDFVILDAPAGIGRGVKNLLGAQAEIIIVATPDDVSIRDAERLGGLLFQRGESSPGLVINRINRKLIRKGEMLAPDRIAQLLDMGLLGAIPDSGEVYRALLRHDTAFSCRDQQVVEAIRAIGCKLLGEEHAAPGHRASPIFRFFNRGGDAQA